MEKTGMYIHEAARLAHEQGKAITHISGEFAGNTIIVPTNTRDCCIASGLKDRFQKIGCFWSHQLEDLIEPIWTVMDGETEEDNKKDISI